MKSLTAYAGLAALIVGLAPVLHGDDQSADVTLRASFGIVKGIQPTGSNIEDAINNLASVGTVALSYQTRSALNGEIPILVTFRNSSKVYLIAGPSFITSINNNHYSGTVTNGSQRTDFNGSDKYTATGAKLYLGAGFGGANGWHGEFLADIGAAEVKEDLSFNATGQGGAFAIDSTGHGRATLYGVSFGAYYTPAIIKGIQIGGRLGYAGASGSIDSGDIKQSGALLAIEAGWVF